MDHAVDFIGKDINPTRIAEQKRVFERIEAAGKDQDRNTKNRRRQHREGDGENRLVFAGTERDRGLLIGRIHVMEE